MEKGLRKPLNRGAQVHAAGKNRPDNLQGQQRHLTMGTGQRCHIFCAAERRWPRWTGLAGPFRPPSLTRPSDLLIISVQVALLQNHKRLPIRFCSRPQQQCSVKKTPPISKASLSLCCPVYFFRMRSKPSYAQVCAVEKYNSRVQRQMRFLPYLLQALHTKCDYQICFRTEHESLSFKNNGRQEGTDWHRLLHI